MAINFARYTLLRKVKEIYYELLFLNWGFFLDKFTFSRQFEIYIVAIPSSIYFKGAYRK